MLIVACQALSNTTATRFSPFAACHTAAATYKIKCFTHQRFQNHINWPKILFHTANHDCVAKGLAMASRQLTSYTIPPQASLPVYSDGDIRLVERTPTPNLRLHKNTHRDHPADGGDIEIHTYSFTILHQICEPKTEKSTSWQTPPPRHATPPPPSTASASSSFSCSSSPCHP